MKITDYLKDFREYFSHLSKDDYEDVESFLSQTISQVKEEAFKEGQKNGKAAYKGKLKREWYMKGFEEGKRSQEGDK